MPCTNERALPRTHLLGLQVMPLQVMACCCRSRSRSYSRHAVTASTLTRLEQGGVLALAHHNLSPRDRRR
jgi:hypothetical protein